MGKKEIERLYASTKVKMEKLGAKDTGKLSVSTKLSAVRKAQKKNYVT